MRHPGEAGPFAHADSQFVHLSARDFGQQRGGRFEMRRPMSIQEAKEFLDKELPKIRGEHARLKAIAEAIEATEALPEAHGLLMGPQTELEFRRMLNDLEEGETDGQ